MQSNMRIVEPPLSENRNKQFGGGNSSLAVLHAFQGPYAIVNGNFFGAAFSVFILSMP